MFIFTAIKKIKKNSKWQDSLATFKITYTQAKNFTLKYIEDRI